MQTHSTTSFFVVFFLYVYNLTVVCLQTVGLTRRDQMRSLDMFRNVLIAFCLILVELLIIYSKATLNLFINTYLSFLAY